MKSRGGRGREPMSWRSGGYPRGHGACASRRGSHPHGGAHVSNRGHYEGDPQRYGTKEEVEEATKRDPSTTSGICYEKRMLHEGLDQKIQAEIGEMDEAIRFAEESPLPLPTTP